MRSIEYAVRSYNVKVVLFEQWTHSWCVTIHQRLSSSKNIANLCKLSSTTNIFSHTGTIASVYIGFKCISMSIFWGFYEFTAHFFFVGGLFCMPLWHGTMVIYYSKYEGSAILAWIWEIREHYFCKWFLPHCISGWLQFMKKIFKNH